MESTEPVTVDVVGDATYEFDLDDLTGVPADGPADTPTDGPTYGDVIRAVGLSRHEATALVDGRPVPEDAAVAPGERIEILRLIQGGSGRRR